MHQWHTEIFNVKLTKLVLDQCTGVEIGIQKKDKNRIPRNNSIGGTLNIRKYNTNVFYLSHQHLEGLYVAKELRKREEELNKNKQERIQIVEKGGFKMKEILRTKTQK